MKYNSIKVFADKAISHKGFFYYHIQTTRKDAVHRGKVPGESRKRKSDPEHSQSSIFDHFGKKENLEAGATGNPEQASSRAQRDSDLEYDSDDDRK